MSWKPHTFAVAYCSLTLASCHATTSHFCDIMLLLDDCVMSCCNICVLTLVSCHKKQTHIVPFHVAASQFVMSCCNFLLMSYVAISYLSYHAATSHLSYWLSHCNNTFHILQPDICGMSDSNLTPVSCHAVTTRLCHAAASHLCHVRLQPQTCVMSYCNLTCVMSYYYLAPVSCHTDTSHLCHVILQPHTCVMSYCNLSPGSCNTATLRLPHTML